MKIEYYLKRSEAVAAMRYINNHSFKVMCFRACFVLLLTIMLGRTCALRLANQDPSFRLRMCLMEMAVGFVFLYAGILLIQEVGIWLATFGKRESGIVCKHSIELREDAVVETTPVNQETCLWSDVVDVCENAKMVFIYTGKKNAHAIPKRAFASEDECRVFVATARAWHHSYHNG